jgi:hypothetical protein
MPYVCKECGHRKCTEGCNADSFEYLANHPLTPKEKEEREEQEKIRKDSYEKELEDLTSLLNELFSDASEDNLKAFFSSKNGLRLCDDNVLDTLGSINYFLTQHRVIIGTMLNLRQTCKMVFLFFLYRKEFSILHPSEVEVDEEFGLKKVTVEEYEGIYDFLLFINSNTFRMKKSGSRHYWRLKSMDYISQLVRLLYSFFNKDNEDFQRLAISCLNKASRRFSDVENKGDKVKVWTFVLICGKQVNPLPKSEYSEYVYTTKFQNFTECCGFLLPYKSVV